MLIKKTATRELPVDDRAGIIGGSSVGAIMGLKGYQSMFDVYLDFIGAKPDINDKTKWIFKRGHILEKAIAEMFESLTGFELVEPTQAYYDPEHPYLILHPDREFIDPKTGKKYALECKMASTNAFRKSWGQLGELINAPLIPPSIPVYNGNEDTLVEQYYAQTQWYYALADYEGVFLARFTDNDIVIYYVEPDEDVQKALYYSAIKFHDDIQSGWEPQPTTSTQAKNKHPKSQENTEINATQEISDALNSFKELRAEKDELDLKIEAEKAIIMNFMKDKEILLSSNGEKLATWKTVKKSKFDSKKFKSDYPHLYESYLSQGATRSFRLPSDPD